MALQFAFNADAGETPESAAQKRRLADMLLGRMGRAQNVGQGIGDILAGIGAGIQRYRADKGDAAGNASAAADRGTFGDAFANMLKGGRPALQTGGESVSPVPGATVTPDVLRATDTTQAAQNDTISQVGAAKPPSGNWLVYNNKGATRNQPISDKLSGSLSFLPEMGVSMNVFSGGQDATGPNRTGSHRHDHGGAADVFFSKDGRLLDWRNKADIPVLQEIVTRARANGVTGFGAGDGYMQPGSMHIGFGSPSVWGAGGKGSNAPGWLREAFNSKYTPSRQPVQVASNDPQFIPTSANPQDVAPQQPNPEPMQMAQMQPAQQPMPQQAPQPDNEATMQVVQAAQKLIRNPYASDADKAQAQQVLDMQMKQVMQANDPAYQMQMQGGQLDLQRKQLELDQMRNPAPDPMKNLQMQKLQQEIDNGNVIEVGGKLVDRKTNRVVYDPGPAPMTADQLFNNQLNRDKFDFEKSKTPAGIQEYQFYADSEKAAGRQPVDYFTFEKGKVPSTTVNVGGAPGDDKLREKLQGKEGETWAGYADAATVSSGTAQDMQILDELINLAPQGPISGRLAQAFPGVSSAGDAFQSVVKRVAPTLRAPGSGSTSDIEYDGMLKSLPALNNKPEANVMISQIMKAKSQINIERGAVIDAYSNGQIPAQEARAKLAEINKRSIMSPEMKKALLGLGGDAKKGGQTKSGLKWSIEP